MNYHPEEKKKKPSFTIKQDDEPEETKPVSTEAVTEAVPTEAATEAATEAVTESTTGAAESTAAETVTEPAATEAVSETSAETEAEETKEIKVTFPEDYQMKSLAGQAVVFKIKINAIKTQELPEFDDEFVSAHLANYAVTADGFIKYYKNAVFDQKLAEYVSGIIVNDTKVTGYPDKFMKILKGQIAYSDQANFEAGGQTGEAYKVNGMTKKEYEAYKKNK